VVQEGLLSVNICEAKDAQRELGWKGKVKLRLSYTMDLDKPQQLGFWSWYSLVIDQMFDMDTTSLSQGQFLVELVSKL
jgi:hypothetical protein